MRKETKTFNVYEYHELSLSSKEKAKKWCLDNIDRHTMFECMCKDYLWDDFCDDTGGLTIQYQLNHWQNDGLNIFGTVSAKNILGYLDKYQEEYEKNFSAEEKQLILNYGNLCGLILIPENACGVECMADNINIKDLWNSHLTDIGYNNVQTNLLNKLEENVIKIFRGLCEEFMDAGYKMFFEVDEEQIEKDCEDFGYEFFEDGTPYCF